MKKKSFILILLVLTALSAFAAKYEDASVSSMYKPGNIIIEADAGIEGYSYSYLASQIPIYAGAEFIVIKPKMGDFAFLDIGFGARVRMGIPTSTYTSFDFSLAPFASAHFGFRGFGNKFLDKLDAYMMIGLGFDFTRFTSTYYANRWVSFMYVLGANYFISDNFRVGVAWTTWGYHSGVVASVALKLGPKPQMK